MLLHWQAFLFLICVASVSAISFSKFKQKRNRSLELEIEPIEQVVDDPNPMLVNGVLYKTFKKYYCSLWNNADDLHTLLHAHEGWTFPRQDVNLTLAYPSATQKAKDYVITGYQIILFMDGSESKALISAGGLLEDYINFTFLCSGINTLSYRFWLYGSERSRLPSREPINMC